MADTIIAMNHIVKSYQMGRNNHLEVLRDVSMEVEKGNF